MPSQVPAGYTRGTLIWTGALRDALVTERLLQLFWEQAGGYGARLLVLALDESLEKTAERYAALFTTWECDTVRYGRVGDRTAARSAEWPAAVEASTGILLLAATPLQVATLLGGTPLAQAIRRANARGRAVAAAGPAAAALCQHMLVSSANTLDAVPSFAPGLGLVNRLVVDVQKQAEPARLLAAVAYNPFLIAVGVPDNSAVALYADGALAAFGAGEVTLVDGDEINYSGVQQSGADTTVEVVGARTYLLSAGHAFNLDSRTLEHSSTDIPVDGPHIKSAF